MLWCRVETFWGILVIDLTRARTCLLFTFDQLEIRCRWFCCLGTRSWYAVFATMLEAIFDFVSLTLVLLIFSFLYSFRQREWPGSALEWKFEKWAIDLKLGCLDGKFHLCTTNSSFCWLFQCNFWIGCIQGLCQLTCTPWVLIRRWRNMPLLDDKFLLGCLYVLNLTHQAQTFHVCSEIEHFLFVLVWRAFNSLMAWLGTLEFGPSTKSNFRALFLSLTLLALMYRWFSDF